MSTSAATVYLNPMELLVKQYQRSLSPQPCTSPPRRDLGVGNWQAEKWKTWRIDALLGEYPALSVQPCDAGEMVVAGTMAFIAEFAGVELSDTYEIRIATPKDFPRSIPVIHEVGGRIPDDFHKLDDGSLCLGSRLRLRILASMSPTIQAYVRNALIPYLYGFTYRELHGTLPFGELGHSVAKFIDDYMQIFRVSTREAAVEMVELASMRRRRANRKACPCGSGLRVGRCHHLVLNRLRDRIGRLWFAGEHHRLTDDRSRFFKGR